MKIAQIAPTWYALPPVAYGGIERVVSNITEEFVKRGHQVDLFASKDSKTTANLIASLYESPQAVWAKNRNDYIFLHAKALEMQDQYDLLHFHVGVDILPTVLATYCRKPFVITYHNSSPTAEPYYRHYAKLPYVSISDSFRKQFPAETNFVATVYNGIDVASYQFQPGGDMLSFLGAISEQKGTKEAVAVAQAGKWKLEIGAKLPPENVPYFKEHIEPVLKKDKKIKFLGEIGEKEKNRLLGGSRAFLFPISWEEPFGLVMVEAMACGTPVVAFNHGAVPELVKDGETGFILPGGDINGFIEAVKKIYDMPEDEYQALRQRCRTHVERHFSLQTMADGYEAVYKKVIAARSGNASTTPWWKFRWQ